MSDRCKKILAKYIITIAITTAVIFFILSGRGFFGTDDAKLKMLYLADAFTIPGVVILMIGVMTWLSSSHGLFDGLTYSLDRLKRSLIPGDNYSDEKYGDYKERKMSSRSTDYSFLFVVGGVIFLVAVIFTLIYKSM